MPLLAQQIGTLAAKNGTHPAVRYLGKDISYRSLHEQISKLSYLFQNEYGHQKRVALITRNAPAVITTFFALSNVRSIAIPVDPDWTDDQMGAYIKETGVTHVAVTDDLRGRVKEMLIGQWLQTLPVIEIEKKRGGEYDTSYTPPADQIPNEKDPVVLLRTKGALGESKTIPFNHQQLFFSATCLKRPYHIAPSDRIHTTLGWHNPFPFVHALLFPLMAGSTCVIDHGDQGEAFVDFMVQAKPTRMVDLPKNFYRLLTICRDSRYTLPGLRSITVGLGALSPALRKAFNLLQVKVTHCYGQTENVWTVFMEDTEKTVAEAMPDRKKNRATPLGVPQKRLSTQAKIESQRPKKQVPTPHYVEGFGLPGVQYKVLDHSGDLIKGKRAKVGQLAVSAPSVMTKYFHQDKETAEEATREKLRGTWLYTGDIVELGGDGEDTIIKFLGRKEDLLWREDHYVFPDRVDPIIKEMPAIQDGCGFVSKNMMGREILACAVVRVPKAVITDKEILDYIGTRLPKDQAPVAVYTTDLIPRDPGGGIARAQLGKAFSGVSGVKS